MGFELFDNYGAASRGEATLRASGYLFIPSALLQRHRIKSAEYVEVYYDDKERLVGLKFYENEQKERHAQRKASQEKSGVAVNLLPLLRQWGVDKPTKKSLEVQQEDGLLTVDIGGVLDEDAKENGSDHTGSEPLLE
jgi:hypothetical protein